MAAIPPKGSVIGTFASVPPRFSEADLLYYEAMDNFIRLMDVRMESEREALAKKLSEHYVKNFLPAMDRLEASFQTTRRISDAPKA